MIKDIIVKISKGFSLADDEQEFLEFVLDRPKHPEYMQLWVAGLV